MNKNYMESPDLMYTNIRAGLKQTGKLEQEINENKKEDHKEKGINFDDKQDIQDNSNIQEITSNPFDETEDLSDKEQIRGDVSGIRKMDVDGFVDKNEGLGKEEQTTETSNVEIMSTEENISKDLSFTNKSVGNENESESLNPFLTPDSSPKPFKKKENLNPFLSSQEDLLFESESDEFDESNPFAEEARTEKVASLRYGSNKKQAVSNNFENVNNDAHEIDKSNPFFGDSSEEDDSFSENNNRASASNSIKKPVPRTRSKKRQAPVAPALVPRTLENEKNNKPPVKSEIEGEKTQTFERSYSFKKKKKAPKPPQSNNDDLNVKKDLNESNDSQKLENNKIEADKINIDVSQETDVVNEKHCDKAIPEKPEEPKLYLHRRSKLPHDYCSIDSLERGTLSKNIEDKENLRPSSNRNAPTASNDTTPVVTRREKRQAPQRPLTEQISYDESTIMKSVALRDKQPKRHEIDRELEFLETRQRELEMEGVVMEKKMRNTMAGEPEEAYLLTWFELVNQKNQLLRRENELIYMLQEMDFLKNQRKAEFELRKLMAKPANERTLADQMREEELLADILNFVTRRSNIVDKMDEDRLREYEEDQQINSMMEAQGLKSPTHENEQPKQEKKKEKKKEKQKKKKKSR